MRTTKGILEGDTSRFAFGVSFRKDPDEGAAATREESLSWGGIEIWVKGSNLCAHREGDTIIEHAHWYLLSLFEWLASCWDYLMHEERLPLRVAGEDGWKSLQASVNSLRRWTNSARRIGTTSGKAGGCDIACLPVGKVAC